MKFSVSSYSYSQLTNSGEYTEKELIGLAKAQGFAGIEFAGLNPPAGVTPAEHARCLAEEAERQGISIVAYCVSADLLNGGKAEIERLKGEVETAKLLGAPVMRHDAAWGDPREDRSRRGFADALPVIAEGCREITRYAETLGIRTCTENHGFFCRDSTRVEAIVNTVANENFGALVDVGNFLCADEDPFVAVGNLAPYAFHVHCKDFYVKSGNGFVPPTGFFMTRGGNYLRGAIVGHGEVPVLQCLRVLKNAGYDGWYTLEFEGMEPAKTGAADGLAALKKMEALL